MNVVRDLWKGVICFVLAVISIPVAAQAVEYIHTDALGTPVAVTNSAGVVVERSEYEPYGVLLNRPQKDGPGFTGHVQDAATGLTYMQQRYYDPLIGRFLSVDPVVANPDNGALFNRYMYAADNPYRFFDPDGRCTGSRITNGDGTCKSTGGFTTMSSSAGPRKGQGMIAQNGRNRGSDSVSAISPTGTANRLSDIKAVKDHFSIGGFGYTESMGTSADVGGNSAMTDNLSGSPHVTYGPITLGNGLSWAGSVIGHEVEIHVPQFLRYKNLSGGQDFSLRELEAHRYNIESAVRFQSPNWQIQYRQNQADKYYYQLTPENREKASRGNYDAGN